MKKRLDPDQIYINDHFEFMTIINQEIEEAELNEDGFDDAKVDEHDHQTSHDFHQESMEDKKKTFKTYQQEIRSFVLD